MTAWNDSQRQAIERVKGNTLVSASAGSGKTAVIVERAIRLLTGKGIEGVDKPVPITSLLMLSFNTSIAAEMKDKIHAALVSSLNGENAELIRAQIDNLPLADITTMHGFCRKLICDNFDVLGIDPSFAVADEEEQSRMFSSAVTSVVEEAMIAGDKDAYELQEFFGGADKLCGQIRRLHGFALSQCDGLAKLQGEWLLEYRKPLDEMKAVKDGLARIATKAEFYAQKLQKTAQDAQTLGMPRIAEYADYCVDAATALTRLTTYRQAHEYVCPNFPRLAYNKQESEADPSKDIKEELARLRDLVGKLGKKVATEFSAQPAEQKKRLDEAYCMLTSLTALVLKADARYREAKSESNRLDFNDLEQLAYKLLCNKEIADEIGSRYEYVCVDEYQDINAIQEAIITAVSGGRDNLFMVGDSKQSIYSFRHTDTDIFLGKFDNYALGKGGEAYKLNYNYRSSPRILSFVNEIFDKIMTKASCGLNYAEASRFTAGLDFQPKGEAQEVSVAMFGGADEGKENFDFTSRIYSVAEHSEAEENKEVGKEAAFIAHTINELLKSGKIYKDGVYRDVTYSDITLLAARRTDNVKSIIGHLRALGIPVSGGGLIKGEGNVYIDRLLDYMRVIDNFRLDIPLAGALMYFGGFDCNECALIREGNKEYLWEAVLDYAQGKGELAGRVADFIGKIRRYRFMSGFTDVAELAGAIVADFDYAERISSRPDGEKLLGELRSFIQGLKSKSYGNSLSAFLEAVKDGYTSEETQSVGAGGCVNSMTVHASKGLEFPVVFLIDCGARFSNGEGKDKLLMDKDIGLALDAAESRRRLIMPTVAKEYVKDVIDDKYITDRMRLFYVGLTRARNYLFVTGTLQGSASDFGSRYKDGVGSMADWINNVCCIDKSFADKYLITDGDFEVGQGDGAIAENLDLNCDCDASYLLEYADKKYAYEECSRIGIKYSVSAINKENYDGNYGYGGGSYLFGEESDTVGSAYHKVLSLIDFSATDFEGVKSAIDNMVSSGELSAHTAELVDCGVIADCLNSPLMTRARGARHMRERKFTLSLPACEVLKDCSVKDKILVQGAVDLMILGGERGGENVLVDFKYTTRPVSEVKKAYAAQLKLYALAMEKCAGIKPDRVVLYLLGSNTEVEM